MSEKVPQTLHTNESFFYISDYINISIWLFKVFGKQIDYEYLKGSLFSISLLLVIFFKEGHKLVVDILIGVNGILINQQRFDGMSPIMIAVQVSVYSEKYLFNIDMIIT